MTVLQDTSGFQLPDDPAAHLRQLASKVLWTETLGKAKTAIAVFNDRGLAPPFYCVHSLSGKATDYAPLAAMLGPDQPFYGIQIPVANRTPDFGGLKEVTIESLAGFYADALECFQPTGPLALGGWSVGAVLALELAQQLRARGRVITLLVAFDLAPWDASLPGGKRLRFAKAVNLPAWLLHHRLVHQRSLSAIRDAVLAKLGRSLGRKPRTGVPTLGTDIAVGDLVDPAHYPPAHGALMTKLLQASICYRAAPYDGAVQVYVARREVPFAHLPLLAAAWRKVAHRVRVTPVRGSHRSMIEARDGQALARDLVHELERAGRVVS